MVGFESQNPVSCECYVSNCWIHIDVDQCYTIPSWCIKNNTQTLCIKQNSGNFMHQTTLMNQQNVKSKRKVLVFVIKKHGAFF